MSASLRGKTIAFSGSFANKSGVVARAVKAGATVSPTMSKKVDFLIRGDASLGSTGMKEAIAKYNGTKIVSANSFINFVHRGGAKKVASAAASPAKTAAAPTPITKTAAKGRVRTIAPSRKIKQAVPTVPLSSLYADKTDAEIEAMEKEAALYGPMPWEKNSKFQKKQASLNKMKQTRALKAKLAAKQKPEAASTKTEAAVVVPKAETKAEAPKTEETPKAAPAVTTDAAPAITFNPSKGLTIEFKGDFGDFCRAANQLVVKNESSSATAVVENPFESAKPEVVAPLPTPAATEAPKTEEKVAEAVPAQKAEKSEKKASSGRNRKVVPTKKLKLADGQVLLKKKAVSFTGTFFQMKRAGLQELAKKAGAKVSTGLSADIDYIVVGADAAHKKRMAKSLGVATLSEKNFISSANL